MRRWHEAQRPADIALEVEPGVLLERRWVPLETVGIYVPRNLVSTLVMCAVPAQAAGVERLVVCTPPAGAGLVAAAAEVLGIDEVWALGGPQAIGWLAYVRKVDKIVGPGNAYVNEAKLEVQRDVAIDLPGGPSEVVVVASGDVDPRLVELELAAQAEHGPDTVCRVVETLEEAEAIAPEHLVLLGDAEALAGRGAERRRRVRRAVLAGRGRRLRDRRQPRPADERLGPLDRRARDRDVPQAGDDPAAHRRGPRADPADRRGARRGRGDARARGGGAAMKELAREFRAYTWAPPSDEVARLAGIDPSQVVRFDQNTPPLPLPSTRPGTIAGALASISGYPPGGYHELKNAIAAYNGVGPENVVLGVGADDLILLIARCLRRARRHDRDSRGAHLPALPDRGAARSGRGRRRRPGSHLHLPAEQPRRSSPSAARGAAARRRRGVLRVLRRDGDPAARRRRDRAAHVLEGLRARGRPDRLRARRPGGRRRAERPAGARAGVDAVGRARSGRRSPRRPTCGP